MKCINNIDKIMQDLEKAIDSASEEIGVTGTADIKAVTPVGTRKDDKHKGQLRRSISFNKSKQGNTHIINFGSDVEYAAKVEFESTSYLRSSLRSNIDKFSGILTKHLKGV